MQNIYIITLIALTIWLVGCGGSSSDSENTLSPAPTPPAPSPSDPPPTSQEDIKVELEDWQFTGGSFDGFNRHNLTVGGAINSNQAGDFAEYEVDLDKGIYRVILEAATPIEKTPTQVQLHLNDCLIATANVQSTSSWNLFADNVVTDQLVVSTSGQQTLKVVGWGEPGTWQWNADRLVISRVGNAPSAAPPCETPPALPPTVPSVEETLDHGEVIDGKQISPSGYTATYPYRVYLPNTYTTETTKPYDVLIITDAEWNFDSFAREVDKNQRQLILVGLENAGRRDNDFRLPFTQTYINFILTEFVPHIVEEYRVKEDTLAFEGFSFGGLMVALSIFYDDTEAPKFKNILSIDGSFWDRSADIYSLLDERHTENENLNINVVLTGAKPGQGNGTVVRTFATRLREQGFKGLTVHELHYDVPHEQATDITIVDSLDLMYGVGGPQ